MRLIVNLELTGLGWADCHIADETSSCKVTASYISDALRHLVLAATAVLSGFRSVTFAFDEEPGEYRWVISTPRLNEIELTILSFPQLWGDKPDSEGKCLFRTKCRPRVFAEAVNAAATEILNTMGERGYAERWVEYPFPTAQLNELQRLLTLGHETV